ncbi:MAG: 5'/3'-nucleotidase SurE [Acidimicrobiales bacterium]|nr:5'/3'-nucleotidase SurE [Acidimicrobiales bacterium]
MRRLIWGLLATTGLLLPACGSDGNESSTPPADPRPGVIDTALASSDDSGAVETGGQRADGPMPAPDPDDAFRVLVTNPEGVSSPGLDAVVSVLAARPATHVEVIAPAADTSGAAGDRSSAEVAPVEAETMTGHRAYAVNGGMLDTLDVALEPTTVPFDLAIVGATTGSAAVDGASQTLTDHGVPVLVIAVDDDPDLAAAGLALSTVLDYHLDDVVQSADRHTLTISSCTSGVARGPVVVHASTDPLPPADCSKAATDPFDDDAEAVSNGFATLAAHP